jgi:hypothetical protein
MTQIQTWIVERWEDGRLMGVSTFPTVEEARVAIEAWEASGGERWGRTRTVEQEPRWRA